MLDLLIFKIQVIRSVFKQSSQARCRPIKAFNDAGNKIFD